MHAHTHTSGRERAASRARVVLHWAAQILTTQNTHTHTTDDIFNILRASSAHHMVDAVWLGESVVVFLCCSNLCSPRAHNLYAPFGPRLSLVHRKGLWGGNVRGAEGLKKMCERCGFCGGDTLCVVKTSADTRSLCVLLSSLLATYTLYLGLLEFVQVVR